MAVRLWFIKRNAQPVAVFTSRSVAREELEELRNDVEESEEDEYRMYPIEFEDLADYPEELELAEEEGLV